MNLPFQEKQKLTKLLNFCEGNRSSYLGFGASGDFNYKQIQPFFNFSMNNFGDWKRQSSYKMNSFQFEKEVIQYFADLFKIDFEKCWGYVTNGSTQGNLFGCYLARQAFPNGKLFCSKDTHNSIFKAAKILRIKVKVVDITPDGIMNYDDLIQKINEEKQPHPIIVANIGTSVLGAIDDIKIIQEKLQNAGYKRKDYYIHTDAAFSGLILPYVDQPQPFTFADGIDSVVFCGHKMIGAPIPCGVVLTKKHYVDAISAQVEYTGSIDNTISGSRNGITPLMLWHAIKTHSKEDFKRVVQMCFKNSDYIIERFHQQGIHAWRHKNSTTVLIPCPSMEMCKKYQLASLGKYARIVMVPHHQDSQYFDKAIQDIIKDYKKSQKTLKVIQENIEQN